MDFSLSAEQSALRDSLKRFCADRYSLQQRQLVARNEQGFSRANWNQFAELGWLGAALPEEAGGFGGSAVECAIIAEEFGRALVLEPYLAGAVVPAEAMRVSAPKTSRQLLDSLVNGQTLFAFAHSEPDDGGSFSYVATTARKTPSGEYVLNGKKSPVPGGFHANRFVVSARTAGEPGDRDGLTLLVIDSTLPGILTRPFRLLDGTSATELQFRDVLVPPSALLGEERVALTAVEGAVAIMLLGLCAGAVGAMDDVIATTASYLKARRAYGTTLISFQALQHRLADMLIELELSKSMLYRTLSVFAGTENSAARLSAASAAKALVGRSARFVSANGIQLHGGMGMVEEYVIGQHFKQLTVFDGLYGNSDFHWAQFQFDEITNSRQHQERTTTDDQNNAASETPSRSSDSRLAGLRRLMRN
jgi:alkylation response protein AidB-like acyl-CoA dehydrogenase